MNSCLIPTPLKPQYWRCHLVGACNGNTRIDSHRIRCALRPALSRIVLGDCGWSSVKIASQETKAVYSNNAIIETCYWENRYKKGRFTPSSNSFVIMEEQPANDSNITLSVTDGTLYAKNNTAYEIALNYKVTRRG